MTSVIIPAYNAEKYLQAAIDSVLSQSDSDWELILVDDGSTDSTARICDLAAEADSRVRALHTPNRGVSAARNAGIDCSSGDYLVFLDADDTIDRDFIKILKEAAETTGCGIVAAPFTRRQEPVEYSAETFIIPRTEALTSLFYQTKIRKTDRIFDTSVWGKLYRKDLWKDLRFTEGRRFEDLEIFHRLVDRTDSIAFVTAPLYFYRDNSESFIRNYSSSRLDVLDVTDAIWRHYASDASSGTDAEVLKAARTRRFAAHCNVYLLLRRNGRPDREAEGRCRGVIRQERRMVLKNSHARLKDRLGALISFLLG